MTNPPDQPSSSAHPAAPPVCRFNPWLFFSFLVAPALLSLSTLGLTQGNDYGFTSVIVLAISSIVAGFVCGIHFTRIQRNLDGARKWGIGIVSVIGCAGVAFGLGTGGCFLTAAVMEGIR